MNKGRNIFLLLVCLLCISVLAFFTLFQRSNTSGVVDDIRYVLDSDEDGVKIYSFYFIKEESVKATVTDDAESWYIKVENCIYNYRVAKGSGEVTAYIDGSEADDEAFAVYTKKLFKSMMVGKEQMLKIWQAVVVAVICFSGGAVIMLAEELWHIIYRKDSEEIPKWSDMNGIKAGGGAIIAAGVILFFIFLFF